MWWRVFPKPESVAFGHMHITVTTCKAEHSNSQLKLLKAYLSTTMPEDLLAVLAMIKYTKTKNWIIITSFF